MNEKERIRLGEFRQFQKEIRITVKWQKNVASKVSKKFLTNSC